MAEQRRPRRLVVALLAGLGWAGGCVQHEVRIVPEPAVAPAAPAPRALVDDAVLAAWEAPVRHRGGLPIETRYSAYRLADGKLWREDRTVSTPLPWWQAFPADIVTDLLWPGTLRVRAEATVTLREVPHLSRRDLDELAARYGYGSGGDADDPQSPDPQPDLVPPTD